MPRKSRQRRGKYSAQARKRAQPESTATASPPAVAREAASEPVKPAAAPAPVVQQPEPVVSRNPFIKTELRIIGIIAGVMLVLLIILAQVVG